jgi:hypothetical protein
VKGDALPGWIKQLPSADQAVAAFLIRAIGEVQLRRIADAIPRPRNKRGRPRTTDNTALIEQAAMLVRAGCQRGHAARTVANQAVLERKRRGIHEDSLAKIIERGVIKKLGRRDSAKRRPIVHWRDTRRALGNLAARFPRSSPQLVAIAARQGAIFKAAAPWVQTLAGLPRLFPRDLLTPQELERYIQFAEAFDMLELPIDELARRYRLTLDYWSTAHRGDEIPGV